jgi:DNA replication protein DnaC
MFDQLTHHLRQLKLNGMATAFDRQNEQPGTYDNLSFAERFQLIIDSESTERDGRKQSRLIKAAKFKVSANAADIDYQHSRALKRELVAGLLQCDWLSKAQNLLLTGPCGSGKTYIACALGHEACMKGKSVKYYRLSRLMLALAQAKADGTYTKFLAQLAKLDCLILDDWGLEPLEAPQRNDLMEIMDDRHGSGSTMILSQLPTDKWHQSIGDNTLADAILDRVMHNAHRIKLKGESMRKCVKI